MNGGWIKRASGSRGDGSIGGKGWISELLRAGGGGLD